MRRFLLYQFPAIAFAILIFVISSIKTLSIPEMGIEWADKIAHLIEYGIFGFLVVRAFYFYPKLRNPTKVYLLAIILTLIYAAGDELHQSLVPGRYASVTDWIADGVGVLIGGMIFRWWHPLEQRVRQFNQRLIDSRSQKKKS